MMEPGNNSLADMMKLLVLAAALRVSYEITRPENPPEEATFRPARVFMPDTSCMRKLTASGACANLKASPPAELPAQIEKWKRKELRGYKEAQEKKWRRWTEAMFEPGS